MVTLYNHYRFGISAHEWLQKCSANQLEIIPMKDIDFNFKVEMNERYYLADIRFPIILLTRPNGRYLIVDGYHRFLKLLNNEATTAIAFIINHQDLNETEKRISETL